MLDDLERSVRRLGGVAAELVSIAYGGYCGSSGSFAAVPSSKHSMVESEIHVTNTGIYHEYENLEREASRLAEQVDTLADKYKQVIWGRSPNEPVGKEQLDNLERYEKMRKARRRG